MKEKKRVRKFKPRKKKFCHTCGDDIAIGKEIKKGGENYCSKACVKAWRCNEKLK